MSKYSVIVLSEFFPPSKAGGGVMISIRNLILSVGSTLKFSVYTSRKDLGAAEAYSSEDMETVAAGLPAKVVYMNGFFEKLVLIFNVVLGLKKDQVLYVNSFFNRLFSMWPVLLVFIFRKSIILAPRGEFSPGALNIKRRRKFVYIRIFKKIILNKRIVFHVSSESERNDVQRVLGSECIIHIARNVSSSPPKHLPTAGEKNRLVFCSRISKKKNLKRAIECLGQVKSDVAFDIYGPLEDLDYWAECQSEINKLPEHVNVQYLGALSPEDVCETISGYRAMVFLTLGENYGHIIAESLQAGVPVVLADTTPWLDLQEQGAGWVVSLDNNQQIVNALEQANKLSEAESKLYQQKCLSYSEKVNDVQQSVSNHLKLFDLIIQRG